ncbi:Rhodanese-like domain-containing protein [Hygrophoropsis aurantiaca]|uniref:Rhodanese-like domain-containing protein n=1 Tax=Hygrophoropsis aurantiaca TaxID=72124 RepID=A0ACB8AM25_9AGAM|nr:Rhodanese-like domain-containing protein [Hygrophoropsis aurantiaca]
MVGYISREKLAEIIKSRDKVPHKDYLIVDVRDQDYVGGNIKGSRNIPSLQFPDDVDELVNETKEIPTVIFHCSLSQSRGPTAAALYKKRREVLQEGTEAKPYSVQILRDGFKEFQSHYKHDPELVENWDAKVWSPNWNWFPG